MPGPDNDNKRRVLEATDIVRLVGEHVTLKAKGREFACLCPFHSDHNPSMYVVPAKQIFHCFVCGAGGNAIDFVVRFHGMGFKEALEFLAGRAGIELAWSKRPPATPADAEGSSREQVLEANAIALRFFRGILAHPEHGAPARAAIEQRAIAPEMVEAFGLGAAPDRWDGLVRYAESKGVSTAALADAGLIKRRDSGDGAYDALRHRLVFPILDRIGRPIAFGGRRIREDDEPKYLNSPETRVFDKGATLFGLKQALTSIQAQRTAVVTEGYTDVIACHQAGFTNVVATLGTALTPKHAAALRGLCDTIILLFDADDAGQRAADRAIEVLVGVPVDVRVAIVSEGKDPDELLKTAGGPDEFRRVLRDSVDLLEYWFRRFRSKLDAQGAPPGSAARDNAITEAIRRWFELGLASQPLLRQHSIERRVWALSGADRAVVERAFAHTRRAGQRPNAPAVDPDAPSERRAGRPPAERALACLLLEPELAVKDPEGLREILDVAAYSSAPISRVAETVSTLHGHGLSLSLNDVLDALDDEAEPRRSATALAAELARETEGEPQRVIDTWRGCIERIRQVRSARTIAALRDGAAAQSESSAEARLRLSRELHQRHGGNPLAMPRPRGGPG